jgi:excinuclease ABC subunit C
MKEHIREILKNLPDSTGVYIMKNAAGEVVYVGKATSLKKRVSSYFHKGADLGVKEGLVQEVETIEYILCESEALALLQEAALIKKYTPRYNVLMRDDKSFPYIELTREPFPRLSVVRGTQRTPDGVYFGPFLQTTGLREALEIIRRIFPYRTCRNMPGRPCLYYHMKLCPGPCTGNVAEEYYNRSIRMIEYILSGDRNTLVEFIRHCMDEAVEALDFERAAFYRDKLESVTTLYGARREFNEMLALQQSLDLDRMPVWIEAVDISGFQRKDVCGSVVVFENGLPKKSEYRRYKIKNPVEDDFRMIEEVVYRRLRRLKEEQRRTPDLLIVDGGRIQVQFAVMARERVGVSVPIIGIAKKNEEIWKEGAEESLRLKRSDPALRLVQRLRDEAHRFVNTYYQKLKQKSLFGNRLKKMGKGNREKGIGKKNL